MLNSRVVRSRGWAMLALVVSCGGGMAELGAAEGTGGGEVVVIYNRRVPESRGVAEHYMAARGVPTNQVFGFDLPVGEGMTREEYRHRLQHPLIEELQEQKLITTRTEIKPATADRAGEIMMRVSESQIRYLVLCFGVPWKVFAEPSLVETGAEKM